MKLEEKRMKEKNKEQKLKKTHLTMKKNGVKSLPNMTKENT